MKQKTINKSVEVVGIGLHKGIPVKLRLEPLEANNGIIFYREDKAISIELSYKNVVDTRMATVIGKNGVSISTIEHLMSAIYAFGIDNIRIVIDNDEVPIMDGSAISFVMLLEEAGIKELNSPKKFLKITKEVEIKENNKFAKVIPNNKTFFDFTIDFPHPIIGKQHKKIELNTQTFIKEIARARTFGFLKEVQYLKSIGLALGGNLDNAIVLDEKRVLNDTLRFPDEFVRHKILDAIGDLSLLEYPIIGEYQAFASGHKLNHLLTKAIIEEKAYEIVTFKEEVEFAKAFS